MKGCLIAVAIVVVLVMGGGLLVWTNRDAIVTGVTEAFELPEYGKQEYIEPNYGELLRSLDAAAANGTSIMTFGAAVEGLNLPEEALYVGIINGEDTTDVIKRFEWNGSRVMTMGNYGAGTLSKADVSKDIMIYKNSGPWSYMDSFIVYIEFTGSKEATSPK